MAAALTFPLISVDEFFAIPEPVGDFTWELHLGELVKVGRPKKRHFDLQSAIRDVLARALDPGKWRVEMEMPYGLSAGFDIRAADVGVALRSKWDAVPEDGYLIGAPDLVVQVKSRSNRDRRMEEDAVLHIVHGASAIWIVKPEHREIIAVTSAARTVYGPGERIELPVVFGIAVDTTVFLPA